MSDGGEDHRTPLAKRIDAAIQRAGGKSAFSRISGISVRNLTRYANENVVPGMKMMEKLAKALNMDVSVLMGEDVSAIRQDIDVSDPISIPLLSVTASAGHGAKNDAQRGEASFSFSRARLRELGANTSRVEFIKARGDSMEPTIKDGSIVLVDRSQKEIVGDAIYVVSIDENVLIKRVQRQIDGTLTLISDNSAVYPPLRLSKADAEQLRVHGRVFWTERLL
ncbi:S24 family peptidase [Methylocystis sp. S23]